MLLWPLDEATCRYCDESIHYGCKEEPSGWTIAVQCAPRKGCGHEYATEWVSLSAVEHVDEVHERAEELARSMGAKPR